MPFYDLVSEVAGCHVHYILFITSESLSPVHVQGERNWVLPVEGRTITRKDTLTMSYPVLGEKNCVSYWGSNAWSSKD